jgi:hypothetical protein
LAPDLAKSKLVVGLEEAVEANYMEFAGVRGREGGDGGFDKRGFSRAASTNDEH